MSQPFRPMLAGKADPEKQRFPLIASPKLDGIRALVMGGKPMSRSMKVLPNKHLQWIVNKYAKELEGLDGELIVGDACAPDVYRKSASVIMSEDKLADCVTFYTFDRWDKPGLTYEERFHPSNLDGTNLIIEAVDREGEFTGYRDFSVSLPYEYIINAEQLGEKEAEWLAQGYEGLMIRDPNTLYKQGRSSTNEGILLKLKRYEDAEAEIIGFEERMHNGNEAFKSELGRTKRSTAQAGLSGQDTLGAWIVKGINGVFKDVEFNVGTGMDDAQRQMFWNNRDQMIGSLLTYKFFNIGVKDKPRHPVFKAVRDRRDMDAAA